MTREKNQHEDIVEMAEVAGLSDGVVRDANDKLVGTWKLVSASSTTAQRERCKTPYIPNIPTLSVFLLTLRRRWSKRHDQGPKTASQ